MSSKLFRNSIITCFCILWMGVYHYMSVKHFYLEPYFKKPLPRVRMLFPPAGWIMFYNVNDQFGEAQVYGIKGVNLRSESGRYVLEGKNYKLIDQHDIFRTRTIFFDNIKRGLIHGAIRRQKQFCDFLEFRFPYFDAFEVRYVYYPEMSKKPYKTIQRTQYQCLTQRFVKNELR